MDLREMADAGAGEARHPWEQHRARFFCEQLGPYLRPGMRVLDVGAGDGCLAAALAPRLQPEGRVICFDTGYTDEQLARFSATAAPGLTFVRDRPGPCFELVLALDVMEHVADDHAFLATIVNDLLAPGGLVLASVPAYPSLFTRHDVELGHHRRYRARALLRLLRGVGLDILTMGGLFHSLLPIRAAQKLVELGRGVRARPDPGKTPVRTHTAVSTWNRGRWLTRTVSAALSIDNGLSTACARRGIILPGLSIWAVGKIPRR